MEYHQSIDLISLEHSGSEPEAEYPQFKSDQDFQDEIRRLKKQSSKKFKSKWEEILDKYSKIDDDIESDEIDILTGKITIDNGHLKSLRKESDQVLNGNVWAIDYDKERDVRNNRRRELRIKNKKTVLKQELKDHDKFMKRPSPTRNTRIAEDNILLLDPSPKKQRVSPTKSLNRYDHLEISPTNNYDTESDDEESDEEPIEFASTPTKKYFDFTPFRITPQPHTEGEIESGSESDSEIDSEDVSNSKIIIQESDSESESSTSIKFQTPSDTPQPNPFQEPQSPVQEESSDFDDNYSIITSPYSNLKPQSRFLKCYFQDCFYTTGNHSIFKRHLLSDHRDELYIIGYPIFKDETSGKNCHVTRSMVQSITKDFPIIHEIPPLPHSKDHKMFKCGLKLKHKHCTREFVDVNELNYHQENYPFKCSKKVQVYVCPVLGCGFMTDEGYLQWRHHFIDKNHCQGEPRGYIHDDIKEVVKHETRVSEQKVSEQRASEQKVSEQKVKSKKNELEFKILPQYTPKTIDFGKVDDEIERLFNSD